ncbi:neutral zinc metallopeptidase [Novipirellula artificiosorum]|uniref:neutral zinc metallopeptidase n=1 Tax=Novipirellula artificiosorum TaxID=2528016 RepID=UPI0018CFA59F|nr:neutral zinc metallopeptidase [Novipirellula artificiosorum]
MKCHYLHSGGNLAGANRSGCGIANAKMGPFDCPAAEKVSRVILFEEMKRPFNSPGDVAQADVLAHEVGHHVRRLNGFSEIVIPERFTRGSSAQRVRWFKDGLASGDLNGCQKLFNLN